MNNASAHSQSVELSVVFTTFNRADVIDEGLSALADQIWDGTWEAVLVDNNSTDDTFDVLEHWAEKIAVPVSVVRAVEGQGPSFARNAGVLAAKGSHVAFIDDDDVIGPGWVGAIADALRIHDVVGSRHEYERLNPPAIAETRHNQTTSLGAFYGIPVVSGGGAGYRREIWERVGGSNTDFRSGQDIDFALRVASLGDVRVGFADDAIYHVRLRPDARKGFEQGERFGRAWVRLHAEHGDKVVYEPLTVRAWCRRWVALGLRSRKLLDPIQRRRWSFDVGYELGRLRGAVVYRKWAGV